MSNRPPRIVIAGAGFGGLYTFRYLSRLLKKGEAEVTIIDKQNCFLFTPLLHEVATASIGEQHASENIDKLVKRKMANFLVDEINSIDFSAKEIKTPFRQIQYDYLVLALGASALSQESSGGLCLKTLEDAIRLKKHLSEVFERVCEEKNLEKQRQMLRFVVVGGGPTGVELAAEISEMTSELKRRHESRLKDFTVEHILIHGSDRLLPSHPETLSNWAHDILSKKGWKIMLKNKVIGCEPHVLKLDNGQEVQAGSIIWTIGVESNAKKFKGIPLLPNGRVDVDENLLVRGRNDVFAIGDNASGQGSFEWPMLAQAAVQNAKVAANNLVAILRSKPMSNFQYHSSGVLISIGRWQAIGEVKGIFIRGPLVWLLWQAVYLFKFISWKKRIVIFVDWILNVFRPRNINIK